MSVTMALPLIVRARHGSDGLAYLAPSSPRDTRAGDACGTSHEARMPSRTPGAGEQYRFHVDMGTCIGCKCCVVACNEQNGNPATINWRRVTDIEGGFFPQVTQTFLSMGCNHCVDPTCLSGCPVDAYTKDAATGIVLHSADACIGCQYCTWNCSYGVPQYNPERGVVGKCDLCHGRLADGDAPACVSACPEGALAVEIVNIEAWRTDAAAGAHAEVPFNDGSLSTTRITAPSNMPPNAMPRGLLHVMPEHPHWSLVVMTVLTQFSVGGLSAIWLLHLAGTSTRLGAAALASLAVAMLALGSATLHLGRPAHAYRALRMWRRSWLSREVLLFGCFAGAAAAYALLLWLEMPGAVVAGGITALLGVGGVTASACIYRVSSRPAWNTPLTLVQFNLTAATLGPLFAGAAGLGDLRWLGVAAATMAGLQLVLLAVRFLRCTASDAPELRGTARLLSTLLAGRFVLRGVLLVAGAIVLPLLAGSFQAGPAEAGPYAYIAGPYASTAGHYAWMAALALALAGEVLGRYLFFVSVVPKHPAAPYLASAREAA